MRMPGNKFIGNTIDYFIKCKLVLLTANFCIKYNMQQQVTELFFYTFPISIRNCPRKLIGFLNSQVSQGLYSLFPVPGTFFTQLIHNGDKTQKRFCRLNFFHRLFLCTQYYKHKKYSKQNNNSYKTKNIKKNKLDNGFTSSLAIKISQAFICVPYSINNYCSL